MPTQLVFCGGRAHPQHAIGGGNMSVQSATGTYFKSVKSGLLPFKTAFMHRTTLGQAELN